MPKGDAAGFVEVVDEQTLLVPDRPGNKLAYGHLNILQNPRVGIIFMIPGTSETLRVNGDTVLTAKGAPDVILSRASKVLLHGEEVEYSAEQTTDLPIEIQPALEELLRRSKRIPTDEAALGLVLRRAPDTRLEPYRDFSEPRRRASADRRNLVNGGRRIGWFARSSSSR